MMKKFLSGLGVLLLTQVVFGEITFSGGGAATIVPFGARFGDPVETVAGNEVRWGDDGPAIDLNANANNEAKTIGAAVGISAAAGNFSLGSNAKVWLKAYDIFKVTLGKFEEDDLRYKIGTSGGGFHNYMLYIRGDNLDENEFLSRFNSEGFGLHLAATPGNFYAGAALGSTFGTRSVKQLREDGATDVYLNAQVGVGYKFENIGFARLMFNGPKPTEDDGTDTAGFKAVGTEATERSPTFQVAFQLTAVPGLNIDIGGTVPLPYEYKKYKTTTKIKDGTTTEVTETTDEVASETIEQQPYIVGIGFDTTSLLPVRFYGRVSYAIGGYTETKVIGGDTTKEMLGNNLVFFLTPMYTVAPNWIVGLDFVLDIKHDSDLSALNGDKARGGDTDAQYAEWAAKEMDLKNNYLDLGFGPYLRHNFAGGDVRFGVTLKLPGGEAHEGAKPQLFIPIILNYNF
jgi:hypothetical protein